MDLLPSRAIRRLLLVIACTACSAESALPATDDGTAHMRPAEQGASSALYFTLRNPGRDTLVLYDVVIDVAGHSMIHRSVESNGMASMEHEDSVVVPPGDSVVFRERGLHVMAMGLRAALHGGDTVVARLHFRPARVDTIRALVRE